MATLGRWLTCIFSLLALVLFATLAVIFGVVTVDQFGTKQYVTDNLSGLPPVYVLSALLVVPCLAFVFAFWMLFMDAFRTDTRRTPPGPPEVELPRSLLGRLRVWRRAH
jgi:TRAP-type C4-dicarboxylate transport system permease small subunit